MAKQIKTQKGRVIKAVASKFFVDTGDSVKVCFARKKLKFDGNIFVGDYVEIAKDRDVFVIESVEERKNQLIRPYVSNVDVCLIVVASEPEPDYVLVDKVIINCLEQNIEPVLVANKADIAPVDL
ncbi:MAG: GTPase RsgA, partial [Clostridia bacterium]|nr:GTPase RsgA [Clostridia bacterium]